MPDWLVHDGRDVVLNIKVQPRASHDEFAGIQADRLRIRLTAPPADGQANRHLARWLASQFEVRLGAVTIENGTQSRLKRVRISEPRSLPLAITRLIASD